MRVIKGFVLFLGLTTLGKAQLIDWNTQIKNKPALFNQMFSNGTVMTSYGDSITGNQAGGCFGATTNANCYVNLVKTLNKWTLVNNAIPGSQVADLFPALYTSTITNNSVTTFLEGYNDMRINGNGSPANGANSYQRALYSALAYAAIPTASIVKSQSVIVTGTWQNAVVYGGATTIYSSVNGSTAAFNLYGQTAYIDIMQFTGSTRGIDVTIDGVDYGIYNGTTFVPPGVSNVQYAPYLIRIPNLGNGTHAVVLTVTTGTGNAYFNWAGSPAGNLAGPLPEVHIANTLHMNATGYTLGAPFNQGSNSIVDIYNGILEDAVRDLSGDLLNISLIDASSNYNTATMVSADNIHPNDAGHASIAQSFYSQINSLFRPRGRGFPYINWRDTSQPFKTSGSITAGSAIFPLTNSSASVDIYDITKVLHYFHVQNATSGGYINFGGVSGTNGQFMFAGLTGVINPHLDIYSYGNALVTSIGSGSNPSYFNNSQPTLFGTATPSGSAAPVQSQTTMQTITAYSAAGTALPTCNAATKGSIGFVSDATAPTFGATYTSGGAVIAPVFCNGTNWKHY